MSAYQIKQDLLVEFTYSIADDTGNIVEQVVLPVNYIHGRSSGMHQKIEIALEGKREGDLLTVDLTPEEGFGPADPDLIIRDNLANVPEQFHEIGAEAEFRNDSGSSKTFRVTKIENGKIELDGNHPMAGKAVSFNLQILQVRPATFEELSGAIPTGQAAGTPSNTPPTLN